MSLSGEFTTMPLPDLLQWLHDTRRSGMLSIAFEFEECRLRIEEGAIVAVESDDPRALDVLRLCQGRGLIDEDAMQRAQETAARTGREVAEVVLEQHLFSRVLLDEVKQEGALELVLGLFLRREGKFHFSPTPSRRALLAEAHLERLKEPIGIRGVLMEGMRRIDEWQRYVEVFPSDQARVHALGHDERFPILGVLARRGEPTAIADLWATRNADRYRIYEQLHQAWRAGLLAVDGASTEHRPTVTSPVDELVHNGELLIAEKQYEEAATILRSALNIDPFRAAARDLLARARQEQLDELYQVIPPYKVPVLRISRERLGRLTLNERERQLAQRINGKWDVGALVLMLPDGELEVLRTLKKLVHIGVVGFSD